MVEIKSGALPHGVQRVLVSTIAGMVVRWMRESGPRRSFLELVDAVDRDLAPLLDAELRKLPSYADALRLFDGRVPAEPLPPTDLAPAESGLEPGDRSPAEHFEPAERDATAPHSSSQQVASHLEKLSLEMSSSPALVAHLAERGLPRRLELLLPNHVVERVFQLPYGLVGPKMPLGVLHVVEMRTPFLFRPEHLVVSPETARAFEVQSFLVEDQQQLGASPLPLETFSIEYDRNMRLTKLVGWQGDTCKPGRPVELEVRRVGPEGEIGFRGVLWGPSIV
jgi:hypothetical protein